LSGDRGDTGILELRLLDDASVHPQVALNTRMFGDPRVENISNIEK
ncbi:hypothetical protein GN958_ATG15287, partial [Phytophthora infestans]